ncbi:MAG: DUF4040 domain-containing protein [bacterium]|nr:DUF4040 domain-containing protein [bacterium]
MDVSLLLVMILMILGAIVALSAKDLLSSAISLGVVGFGLVIAFLILKAPDLAIVQIVVETLTLVIFIYAIQRTSRADTEEGLGFKRLGLNLAGLLFLVFFMTGFAKAAAHLPEFGKPILRMAGYYLEQGLSATGAANLVTAVILDFRAYDTLGEATVLFAVAVGVLAVLRKAGLLSLGKEK